MTHMSVYGGLFSDPPLISTHPDPKLTDPYNKMDTIPSRYLGKGMSVVCGSTGRGPEVFFEKKYLTLASPEQNGNKDLGVFEDNVTRARREAMGEKKKNISTKEFLPPSFPKQSDGPGSYSGCFQNRPHEFIMPGEEGGNAAHKKKKRKKAAATASDANDHKMSLPNIKTNPPKKGTYGTPGVLLDNPKYNENWKQELEQWELMAAKRQKKVSSPKPIGAVFKIPGVGHDYLDEFPTTGVSRVYQYIPLDEKPSKRKKRGAKPPPAAPVFKQDKPMSFTWTKSGDSGCLATFPNTWINAAELEEARNKAAKKKHRKKTPEYVPGPPKGANGIWKPNSFPDTTIVQSCLRRFY